MQLTQTAPKIYTIPQTAKILKTCDKTIRRLVDSKQLRAFRAGGWRITESAINEFIKEGEGK